MSPIAFFYFAYMFISLYFLILTLLLYFKNKDQIGFIPPITKNYSLCILVPAFNEEKTIADTIHAIYSTNYNNLAQVIVINDGSKDNTLKIAKSFEKKYKNLLVLDKNNSGKAGSINYALKYVKTELVGIIDADSFPDKEAFSKLVGYFDDKGVGAVTATCVPRNQSTFLEKLQTIEYKVIAFTRKLLEFIESIYVAPGSLSIYRTRAIRDIGGFDTKNITEDIEATWHILKKNWKVKMCFNAYVTTKVPDKIKPWFRQRRRWALGGLQCIEKYRKQILRENMFGYFVVPFFTLGLFLGVIGIGVLLYLLIRKGISYFLLTRYSIETSVPLVIMSELYITPSVLNYFGLILFALFLVFNLFVLGLMKDKILGKQSFFNLLFYMTIYLLIYPLVLITAIWHYYKGKMVWR
ncbi:glycosyltransferase family 2 protein [Candidatus Pacearchaeota archaeon]|nr:glycosyltransferase family 2 protein [Candidatus Pacearchaeota archaeon]